MLKKFLPKRDIFFAFFEKHVSLSFKAAEQLLLLSIIIPTTKRSSKISKNWKTRNHFRK
jgi:hypothetical protein